MRRFSVGEEVLYEGRRYVLSRQEGDGGGRVRLLATTPEGTRVVWTVASKLDPMDAYTRAVDDTERNARRG